MSDLAPVGTPPETAGAPPAVEARELYKTYIGGDGTPLHRVRLQQARVRPIAQYRAKLPTQVVGVLNAGVQALAAGG